MFCMVFGFARELFSVSESGTVDNPISFKKSLAPTGSCLRKDLEVGKAGSRDAFSSYLCLGTYAPVSLRKQFPTKTFASFARMPAGAGIAGLTEASGQQIRLMKLVSEPHPRHEGDRNYRETVLVLLF